MFASPIKRLSPQKPRDERIFQPFEPAPTENAARVFSPRILLAFGVIFGALGLAFVPIFAPFRFAILLLCGAISLFLAPSRAAFFFALAAFLALWVLRFGRGQTLPFEIGIALAAGGFALGFWLRKTPEQHAVWGLFGVLGSAMLANTFAQGFGVAALALGGAFSLWWETAHARREKLETLWILAAGLGLLRFFEARTGANFGAATHDFLAIWGALGVAAIWVQTPIFDEKAGAKLRAILATAFALGACAIWGPRVFGGLFLGFLLGAFWAPQNARFAAWGALVLVALAPFLAEISDFTRLERLQILGGFAVVGALVFAVFRWAKRRVSP